FLRKAGIRYVEVPALPFSLSLKHGLTTFVPEALSSDDIRDLRNRLRGMELYPITVTAMCQVLDAAELEALRRRIDFAHDLECKYVITDSCDEAGLRQSRSKVIDSLRSLAEYAAERGVCLALETHAGPTRNGRVAKEFLDEIAHPNLGYNYDTGNIVYYNENIDPAKDIREIAKRVVHVHLKDTQGGQEEWKFCGLGEGRVNFAEILRVLQAANFTGPYSLEIEGMAGEDLNREGYLQRVRRSLAYLKSIGLAVP
ncbi:MAG: sugar phosphate isomerase/epimerase family protein, partial [Terriglobales bacterium]